MVGACAYDYGNLAVRVVCMSVVVVMLIRWQHSVCMTMYSCSLNKCR